MSSTRPADHRGHHIVHRSPDMGGAPVVICVTCNVRLDNE